MRTWHRGFSHFETRFESRFESLISRVQVLGLKFRPPVADTSSMHKLPTIEEVTLRLELIRILKECAAQDVRVDPKDLPTAYIFSLFPVRATRQKPIL